MSRLIIVDISGNALGERVLNQERIRIGRRADNELVLDDLSVSNEHALVITIRNDSFIQDLNSMNGVRVNGRLIRHHHLQDGDEVTIGTFTLRYVHEPWVEPAPSWRAPDTGPLKEETVRAVAPQAGDTLFHVAVPSDLPLTRELVDTAVEGGAAIECATVLLGEARPSGLGHLRLLAGPGAGRETALTRAVTTLGKPGIQTAIISRRGGSYFLTFAEGDSYPQVNGVEVGAAPHPLKDHDILDVAGTRLEFFYR
ncbi:FHA domain-containing protein [Thiobacter aerophilum]|uniref:FHA domain-containing protein n=1 Tax=Thiobacter aerophilum TaxID=3121275 RepID=A0ABV0EF69_9BURK